VRILYTAREFYPSVGGTQTYMLECARRLVARGHEVEVFCLNGSLYSEDRLEREGCVQGVRIRRFPFVRTPLRPLVLHNVITTAREMGRFDLIHTHDIRFLFETSLLAHKWFGKPLIASSHGYIFHQRRLHWLKKSVFQFYYRPLLAHSSGLHVISAQDRSKVRGLSGRVDIREIGGGITYQEYATVRREPQPGRLLYFGRLDSNKGVELVLQLMPQLPELELHLVYGAYNPEYKHSLEEQQVHLGIKDRVHWHGRLPLSDLLNQMAQCQYVILPSRYEGFGLTTLEAMAAAVPVICNNIDAFQNIITDGKNGILIDFANRTLAVEELRRCLNKSSQELAVIATEGQATASHCDWDLRVTQLERWYNELIPGRAFVSPESATVGHQ
jgi:alpha-1,3-mannosyltransferase